MIIEQHTFTLADGVSDDDFLAADKRVQGEFAPFQTGFIRRTTARSVGSDGWLVAYFWFDEATADAAKGSGHEAVAALRACIDPVTLVLERWETLD